MDFRYVSGSSSYATTRQRCIDAGGQLAEIRTQQDYDRVLEWWEDNFNAPSYIGGNTLATNGEWAWDSNGDPIPDGPLWDTYYPNVENACLAFMEDDNDVGKLKAVQCTFNIPGLCDLL